MPDTDFRAAQQSGPSEDFGGARILVTGADGFMGSGLCERLLQQGSRVTALVRRTSRSSIPGHMRNLLRIRDRLESIIQADVAEADWYLAAQHIRPDIVFHLAADAFVPAGFTAPREVMRANVGGTVSVLEFCRSLPTPPKLIVMSSSEVYGSHPAPIDELVLPQPTTPYAASKLAADRVSYSYAVSFGLPIVICRPFNTYGPRHPYDVIPRFLRAALTGAPIEIFGDGMQSRDFMYIDDLVRGLCRVAATPGLAHEVINLGTGVSTSIRELAELVVRVSGTDVPIVHLAPRQGEVLKLECDASKAERLLDWRATVPLEAGLAACWEWTVRNKAFLLGANEA
jgi:nucleoside-diphosphate-sugar epimerase